MNHELNTQIKKLEDELAKLKAIAEKKQGWFVEGCEYHVVYNVGSIFTDTHTNHGVDAQRKAQGCAFRTRELAEAFSEYERAVVRINDAIDAGEAGMYAPLFWRPDSKWSLAQDNSPIFHSGGEKSFKRIIQSHATDFAIIKRYMDLRDAEVALQRGA